VYEKCMPNLVEMVLKGVNATVFAYGITGSGKTHTMMGPPRKSSKGLI
jgi:Tfp pilus assembly pilus retraction ATPase PilT